MYILFVWNYYFKIFFLTLFVSTSFTLFCKFSLLKISLKNIQRTKIKKNPYFIVTKKLIIKPFKKKNAWLRWHGSAVALAASCARSTAINKCPKRLRVANSPNLWCPVITTHTPLLRRNRTKLTKIKMGSTLSCSSLPTLYIILLLFLFTNLISPGVMAIPS